MRWGLVPPWAKAFKSTYTTINARVEEAYKKPAYRHAWKHRQFCLIPALGYYEWKNKQPYFITKPDDLICFAGLWESWQGQLSCTILTEPSQGDLQDLHHRMPVMLDTIQAQAWVDIRTTEAEAVLNSVVYRSLHWYRVGPEVGNWRNQGEGLIQPDDDD